MKAQTIEKLYAFLKQPSTIKGLVGVLGCAGIVLRPQDWEAISFTMAAAYSVYQILRNEDKQIEKAKK